MLPKKSFLTLLLSPEQSLSFLLPLCGVVLWMLLKPFCICRYDWWFSQFEYDGRWANYFVCDSMCRHYFPPSQMFIYWVVVVFRIFKPIFCVFSMLWELFFLGWGLCRVICVCWCLFFYDSIRSVYVYVCDSVYFGVCLFYGFLCGW